MRLLVLASGSSGNSALIESGGRAVLLDAGISARETLRRVARAGAADAHIEAILLTHEHSDHVRGVRVLARRLGIPVMATPGTLRAAGAHLADVPRQTPIDRRESFTVAGIRVTAFATEHDATEPVGYAFESRRGHRVVVATDTGIVTDEVAAALAGAHVIGLEANHDALMLDMGPYPPFLKRRIASDRGHLSNEAAASALASASWSGLAHVFALHISEQNNTPDAAVRALSRSLHYQGGPDLAAVVRNEIAGCTV
jgi:phosphoribosyl 1,2-cyclic phosphodiesterase